MSVTFFCPDAPVTHYDQRECFCVLDGEADSNCRYCDGEGVEHVAVTVTGEVNLANSNFAAIMRVLGLEWDDYCGSWSVEQLPHVAQVIMSALNSRRLRVGEVVLPNVTGGDTVVRNVGGVATIGKTCRVHDNGRSDDYIVDVLSRLYELVVAAKKHNLQVSFG